MGSGWGRAGIVSDATLASQEPTPRPLALWVRATPGADAEDLAGDLAALAGAAGAGLDGGYDERVWVDLQVDVLFKQGSGVLTAGKMPMVFFFPEGRGRTAATAGAGVICAGSCPPDSQVSWSFVPWAASNAASAAANFSRTQAASRPGGQRTSTITATSSPMRSNPTGTTQLPPISGCV